MSAIKTIDEQIEEMKARGINVVCELDNDGNILAFGTEEEYDTHAIDVMNGNGYYDELGNYVSYYKYNGDY